MLLSLHIENIAVIKSVDLDLSDGFTALTGETGAGKSIIIDSINLLLGSRADKNLIRHGEERACVVAMFGEISGFAKARLKEMEIEPDEEDKILVYRSFSVDGHSSIKINGQAVNITVLRDAMKNMIAIHGQNVSQCLTNKSSHIELLDRYSKNGELVASYGKIYEKLLSLRHEMADLNREISEKDRNIDILKYQISEIETLKLKSGEESLLEDRLSKLKNVERITRYAGFIYRALKDGERANALYIIDRCLSSLSELSEVIPDVEEMSQELSDCRVKIDDIAEKIRDCFAGIEGDPVEMIDRIQGRLDSIARLKKKYGDSIDDILAYNESSKEKLKNLENADLKREDLASDIRETEKQLAVFAKELSDRRKRAAGELEKEIGESLKFLDMPKVSFVCSVTNNMSDGAVKFDKYGFDNVNFLISANSGLPAMPLDKIASGGELSRIMLSIKSVLSDSDGIQTVIYDEIDTGVSGKTARKIGYKLKKSSESAQVICVTHSAQIASLSDTHFLILKRENERAETETSIKKLDQAGRIDELSRILGGINVTDSQRLAAIDMLMETD